MSTPLLEIKNLHIYFRVYEGTLKVLSGVDLTVCKKEKVGIIGETGCGKSTPMRAMLRILPDNAIIPYGEILFNGKDVLKLGKKELQEIRRKSVSMIFQDPTAALNPVFKVGTQLFDTLKYSAKGKNLSKSEINAEIIQILREVALPDPERILENYPFQLSGGMRQRVCIAMAMVTANELLIADEPGSSLDATIEDQILRLIGRVVEGKKISAIHISHSLGAVKGLAEKVYVMYAGTIVEVAETEELFSNPLHPYTIGLLRAIPKITGGGVVEGIRGRVTNYLNPPEGCRFFPRCDLAEPLCKSNRPLLFDVSGEHKVACFKYGRL
jgi:peptide/nickel transport system ATP-binding protein